jgi:hypothetical protein
LGELVSGGLHQIYLAAVRRTRRGRNARSAMGSP